MSKRTDLRVIRTKKSIKTAFLNLLKIKNYNKITIGDIAEEAMINRNTFYLHYLDKDDLLDQLSNASLSKLKESMDSSSESKRINDLEYDEFYEINKRVFKAIEEDFDFYKIILRDESIPYLSFKFNNVVKSHMIEGLKKSYAQKGMEKKLEQILIYVEYMTAGLIGVIHFWIDNKGKYSIDEVSEIVINMYSKDILKLLKEI